MKLLRTLGLSLWLIGAQAIAASASEATVRELLAVTQSSRLLDGMRGQFDALMDKTIEQALGGQQPTFKQQQAITKMKDRMVKLMSTQLAWNRLEPVYIRLYRESFSEEEVEGMLAFYKTPTGQAVITRQPELMRKTMIEMQQMMAGTMPVMEKIRADFIADMNAASGKR